VIAPEDGRLQMKSVPAIRIVRCNESARSFTKWRIRTLATAQGEKGIVLPLKSLASSELPRGAVTSFEGLGSRGTELGFVAHFSARFVFQLLS